MEWKLVEKAFPKLHYQPVYTARVFALELETIELVLSKLVTYFDYPVRSNSSNDLVCSHGKDTLEIMQLLFTGDADDHTIISLENENASIICRKSDNRFANSLDLIFRLSNFSSQTQFEAFLNFLASVALEANREIQIEDDYGSLLFSLCPDGIVQTYEGNWCQPSDLV